MGQRGVVIVGGGQAAYHLATTLRRFSFQERVTIVTDEPHLPYQRPPLSKHFLGASMAEKDMLFSDESFFRAESIEIVLDRRAAAIDRYARTVTLNDGERIHYAHLVLATGARNRPLPLSGGLPVHAIRGLDDALRFRDRLRRARSLAVIGGGFLGLEVASHAAKTGIDVSVLEMSPALMSRTLSASTSALARTHLEGLGVRVMTSIRIMGLRGCDTEVEIQIDGRDDIIAADLVLSSIGVCPNDELARESGFATADGILVDERMAAFDETISAIGDCARFPDPAGCGTLRIESVQNAVDQAEVVASRLTGAPRRYDAVPVFWSEQAGTRIQIAGSSLGHDHVVSRISQQDNCGSAFLFKGDRLVAVESVNAAADHFSARKALAANLPVDRASVANPDEPFRALVKRLMG